MTLDDIEKFEFWTDGKVIYRLGSWCAEPTVSFINMETRMKIGGGINSLLVNKLVPLTKENFEPQMIDTINVERGL